MFYFKKHFCIIAKHGCFMIFSVIFFFQLKKTPQLKRKSPKNPPPMTIPEIKKALSIQSVLDHYNLCPDRNDRLLCPWHDDKRPSLHIYPKTNTWTCFSTKCHAGSGDVIDFIMKHENVTKHQSLLPPTSPPSASALRAPTVRS